jgi:DNA polymerase-1
LNLGNKNAPIYVVCEPPAFNYNQELPTSAGSISTFLNEAVKAGFNRDDFYFIKLCEPIPEDIKKSKAKTWKHVLPNVGRVQEALQARPGVPVVCMGDLATRAVIGRAAAITKVRGTLLEGKVYPIFTPSYCRVVLEQFPIFKSDIATLKKLSDVNFRLDDLGASSINSYWCTDLSEIIKQKPKVIAIDTETTGLRQTASDFQVLTVQIAYSNNDVAVCPLHPNFWPGEFNQEDCDKLKAQIKELCEDASIRKVGQNINYEVSSLAAIGITLRGILADTQVLAWFVDENMQSKSLDDIVRRWVPALAGLNDQLNLQLDKSNMINTSPEDILIYGGNDGVMTYQAFWALWNILKLNEQQMKLFLKLKMPGLSGFQKMESQGVLIDKEYLKNIAIELEKDLVKRKAELLDLVPKKVIRKHLDNKKELKFSRGDFVRDILFTSDGFNLTPVVFTKGTKDSQDKVASTSAKDHLPFFSDLDGTAGDFVDKFMEFTKLSKLSSTYVKEFYDKYVHEDGCIHPQFNLHITVTGRSSSRGPNAQNFPSRGEWSKKYKKIFVARPGYKFISADLSQIELRLIAWESRDPVMLEAYRTDKDIHTITAMAVSGHNEQSWNALSKDDRKLLRFRAKAVNFGFCYGMRAAKFRRYAKTDYGIDLTEEEARHYYNTYHRLYRNIQTWHNDRVYEAHKYGFVTSLHGAIRHVPSVYSENKFIRSQAERQGINSPIQAFGSDLGVLAIARIARQANPEIIRPVMFIHDDIILEVKDGHEQEAINTLLWVLDNPPLQELFGIRSPIPIKAEPDIGLNLGEMYEIYDLKDEDKPYWMPELHINPEKPSWWNDEKDLI